MHVRATAFLARAGAPSMVTTAWQTRVVEFQRFNEVRVPDHRLVGNMDILKALVHARHQCAQPSSSNAESRNTAACFCIVCCISRRISAVGEPPFALRKWSMRAQCKVRRVRWQLQACAALGCQGVFQPQSGGSAKHDKVDQAVGTQGGSRRAPTRTRLRLRHTARARFPLDWRRWGSTPHHDNCTESRPCYNARSA